MRDLWRPPLFSLAPLLAGRWFSLCAVLVCSRQVQSDQHRAADISQTGE